MTGPWVTLSADERFAWHWDQWRRALPALGVLVLAALLAAPVLGPAPLMPLLPLLGVIVWSLYQPRLMPPLAAFAIGAVTDLAMALPLGVNATLMPVLVLVLRWAGAKLGKRAFLLDWLGVGPVIAAYQLAAWALAGLVGGVRDPSLLVGQTLISWAVFPAIARAAAWVQARIS